MSSNMSPPKSEEKKESSGSKQSSGRSSRGEMGNQLIKLLIGDWIYKLKGYYLAISHQGIQYIVIELSVCLLHF